MSVYCTIAKMESVGFEDPDTDIHLTVDIKTHKADPKRPVRFIMAGPIGDGEQQGMEVVMSWEEANKFANAVLQLQRDHTGCTSGVGIRSARL